jgi:SnoaL-like domain
VNDEDVEAIRLLKARYFRLLDTKDWIGWRELFTDDLTFYLDSTPLPSSTTPLRRGADDFVNYVSAALASCTTVHQGHMPEIEVVDEHAARGIWAMFDWVKDAGHGEPRIGYGHYHELYEKGTDGRWRIKELRLTRLLLEGPSPGALVEVRP